MVLSSRSHSLSLPMPQKQRGVVLFFALIALLAMSLAAVALVRSVDTNTLIAGNLAFKQSATATGDTGLEQAINWMIAQSTTANGDVLTNIAHPLNITNFAVNKGYHSDSTLDPTAPATWETADNFVGPITDPATGNTVRYIIQRMCRTPNTLPKNYENNVKVPPETSCLFLSLLINPNSQSVVGYGGYCPTCARPTQLPVYRITARVDAQKGTTSYVQALAY